jgi:hypothetical protein
VGVGEFAAAHRGGDGERHRFAPAQSGRSARLIATVVAADVALLEPLPEPQPATAKAEEKITAAMAAGRRRLTH